MKLDTITPLFCIPATWTPRWKSTGPLIAVYLAFSGGALAALSSPGALPATPPSTPREFFNVGTEMLRAGKLREAEAFLQSVLAAQNERLQPPALYNLGHVRFAQGIDELKKGPSARSSLSRAGGADESADGALREAEDALAGSDIQRMISAYLRGRGARRDLRQAAKAVRQAMETYGTALSRWQRASGDFKSAVELRPHDEDARQNAEIVDRSIAKLVDSLRQLQQAAAMMGQKQQDLKQKMERLKGQIPEDQMPPGAAGDDEEDEDLPNGPKPDDKESAGKEGEQQMSLSPEQAGWLLEGFKLDKERRLPMGQNDTAEPRNRARKTW
ncbi:MAG TPA: hypothetical protein VJA21_18995 [Verrucomicrobiae bacterium]